MYLLTYAPNKDSNLPAHLHSLISLHFHEETFHPWLSKMCSVKILFRLCEYISWSESSLSTHVRRYIFSHCSLFVVHICIVSDKRVIQMNICLFFFWHIEILFRRCVDVFMSYHNICFCGENINPCPAKSGYVLPLQTV